MEINTINQEKILEKFLEEKNKKTKSYRQLEESEGGIKFLFENAPFFTSIMWLMYRVEASENAIKKVIVYQHDYETTKPNNFQRVYFKYFFNIKDIGAVDLTEDKYYNKIYDFSSSLGTEIIRLKELLFGFHKYYKEGECLYDDKYVILDDEFLERVILPLTQGKYDEVLKREVMKFIMTQNLKNK